MWRQRETARQGGKSICSLVRVLRTVKPKVPKDGAKLIKLWVEYIYVCLSLCMGVCVKMRG